MDWEAIAPSPQPSICPLSCISEKICSVDNDWSAAKKTQNLLRIWHTQLNSLTNIHRANDNDIKCFNWCALVTWGNYPSIWDLKGFHSYLSYFNFWGQKIRTLIWIFFWSFSPWKCEKKLATSPPVSSSIPSGHRQFFTKCLMSKWAVPLPSPQPLITIPEL